MADNERALTWAEWDWWPLARLLTTGTVLGFAAHRYLGWTPDLRPLATLPRELFEVFSFFALISFGLAHLYLLLIMLPLSSVVVLNDTFYDASRHAPRDTRPARAPRALDKQPFRH